MKAQIILVDWIQIIVYMSCTTLIMTEKSNLMVQKV